MSTYSIITYFSSTFGVLAPKKSTFYPVKTIDTGKIVFQSFLKGDTQIMADEAFQNAVQNYYDVFLCSERIAKMVQSGGCCQNDFREVFRNNIEKRVR